MSIAKGYVIVVCSGVVFAAAGAGIGYGLGVMLPDYYRTVFRVPPGVPINTAQAGIGLGLTQGLIVGLIVGAIITVGVAWCNARAASNRPPA